MPGANAVEELNNMEWISVKDRLPPFGENVLVCERYSEGDKLYVSTLAYRQDVNAEHIKRYGGPEWHVVENCGGSESEPEDCNPEFWMPIPPAPAR